HWYSVAEQVRLPGLIRAAGVDLVHFPHFNVPLASRGPYVVTIHDLTHELRRTLPGAAADPARARAKALAYKLVLRRAVARARRIVAVSETTKRALVDTLGVAPGKVTVTHEGVDMQLFEAPDPGALARLGVRAPYFLYVGSAFPHKNLGRLLDAFARSGCAAEGHQLVLAGNFGTYRADLESRARDLAVRDSIVLAGAVSDAELAALYRGATALVLVSLAEGFGLPGLEAMGLGVPVLASRIDSLVEIYGEAALSVEPSDTEAIAARLRDAEGIAKVDVAGPGFLNISLAAASLGAVAHDIVEAGASFGRSNELAGQRINLEFVSANPTGPVHLGHTRWAALGDSLRRLLQAAGAEVAAEHYINDYGAQMDKFAASLLAVAQGREVAEDGYHGDYVFDVAKQVVELQPDVLALPEAEALETFRAEGVDLMFSEIKASLHDFGVDFDVFFHENSLHESGAVDKAVQQLKDSGSLYFADNAWWLRSTDYGDDKDRVVIKSDGNAAYVAGDLAYLRDKRARGADLCIYLLGADHHGYIARLKAAAAAFGDDPATVEVLIGQLVNLVKDGKPVRMGKRAGNIITMEDLVDAVGVDAARYALERSAIETTVDIDLDLLVKRSNDNPVYYVQYAHARTSNVRRNAESVGIGLTTFEPALLDQPADAALLTALGEYPRIVSTAAQLRAPHRIAHYLESLAGVYHRWYDTRECRVMPVGDEPISDANRTRAWLNEATRTVLANGLGLLGVTAPDRM
ncbi:MAG: arginyl-tRNA synthetase, partial [Frankiaceae bacterium]|nr:arginyl-tRNA synthetase [Frankiaceae bacterium]